MNDAAALGERLRAAVHPLDRAPAGVASCANSKACSPPASRGRRRCWWTWARRRQARVEIGERVGLQFGGQPRHVLQYRHDPQRIWGATASILYNLRERLLLAAPGRT